MTNFGAHQLDIVQWALGRDDSGPVQVEATATFHPQHWYEVPMTSHIRLQYDDGTPVVVEQGGKGGWAVTFEGASATLKVDRGKIEADPADLLKTKLRGADVHLEVSKDHHGNWLDCVRTRKTPIADVAIGHRSATVCHLANLAIRTGRTLKWDPVQETIRDDSEAARMLSRPYRAPWALPGAKG